MIEGFPRSANTFSAVAFQFSQKKEVRMAHHLHVEAQIIYAAHNKIPILLLIRNPKDAVKSLLVRHPETNQEWALKRYIKFYSNLTPFLDNCHVAKYEDVISDFGKIIDDFNEKFSTSFNRFEHSKENVETVFKQIDIINKKVGLGLESQVARPSKEKNNLSNNIFFEESSLKHIKTANKIYAQCCLHSK